MRECNKCGTEKPLTDFYKHPTCAEGRLYMCKTCSVKAATRYANAKPEATKARKAAWYQSMRTLGKGVSLHRDYWPRLCPVRAISLFTFMRTAQKNVCAICLKPERVKLHGTVKSLAVDHDHKTGQVRGLLCSSCNLGLGRFHDSITNLERAAEYLRRNSCSKSL